jgi:Flp pilus assembly protein TadD
MVVASTMHVPDAPPQFDGQQRLAADSPWARTVIPTAILAATFLTYVATLALGFVFDDHVLILTNDAIRSWRYFPSYFTSHIWSFHYPHLLANYYRPFFLVWLRLNDALFGVQPWGWHLTSMLAHIAVTYLVYRLAFRLMADRWAAGVAGLIFGLHPIHAEAVADITSIQEPLSAFFILAAILAFARDRESAFKGRWLAAALALTGAALLCKESGMVLPLLVIGYAWVYGGVDGGEAAPVEKTARLLARARSALYASIPFWIVILLYVPVRIRALKGFAHVITPLPFATEILTIPSVLAFYLRLLVWPSGLSCYYDTPYVSSPSWKDFILPALLVTGVAAGLAFWYVRTRRSAPRQAKAIAFACFWMILTLLPVLNFRYLPEGEIAHDRYVYLPSVGFVVVVAIALRQAWSWGSRFIRRPVWLLLGALVGSVLMGYATARQCLFWSDDLTLNYRAHEIAPHNLYATTSLAAAVAKQGMEPTAITLYQQALAIQPKLWQANVNLGYLYYAHENYAEAERYFARASAIDPFDGDQFLYLGMSLLRMGRFQEAEKAVRTALLVRPQGRTYHLGLGMVLKGEGKLAEARQEVEAELAEDPQNAQAKALLDELTRLLEAPVR